MSAATLSLRKMHYSTVFCPPMPSPPSKTAQQATAMVKADLAKRGLELDINMNSGQMTEL